MALGQTLRWFDALRQDVIFGWRVMRRGPLVSAIAVVTLALGIGANTAVFSLLDAVLLHPLPYSEPDRLFMLWTVEGKSQRGHHTSYPDFDEWRSQARSFQGMAAFHGASFNVTGGGGAERIFAIASAGNLLDVLGVPPAHGLPPRGGEENVAIISHGLALRRFGEDAGAIGRPLVLDGEPYTVVRVLPRGFHFEPRLSREPDAFVPLKPNRSRTAWMLRVVGRLRPGVSQDHAQAEMDAIAKRIAAANPDLDPRQGIRVDEMHRFVVQDAGTTGLLLLGAVMFLLLVACANVANLLVSRAIGREREIAVRAALGASRARLARQLLTEAVMLAAAAAVLGVALAYLCLPALASFAPERTSFFTRVQDNGITINSSVLAFTAAVSLVAALLFGIVPALRAARPAGSTASRVPTARASRALVAIEVALSFVLLAGAALMLTSLRHLMHVDPGFRISNLLTLGVSLPQRKYEDGGSRARYFDRALASLNSIHGVRSADAVEALPMSGDYSTGGFEIDGASPRAGSASLQSVGARYFETMEIAIVGGRALRAGDTASAPRVAVINAAMARRYWPGANPIGEAIVLADEIVGGTPGSEPENRRQRVEIVGVAADVRQLGLDAPARSEIYMPFSQRPVPSMTFVLRTEGKSSQVSNEAARALARIDAELPITDVRTLDEWIRIDTAARRFVLALIGLFAVVALVLAASGIYAVVAHSVTRRRHELAVRLALGARPRGLVSLVTRQQFPALAIGVGAGLAGALGLTRFLAAYLFDVTATDPLALALAAIALLAVGIGAQIVPAWRVTRIEPAGVLKSE